MRADISPLLAAKTALAAAESAERHGDMEVAFAAALDLIEHAEAWRDELYRVAPESGMAWGWIGSIPSAPQWLDELDSVLIGN